MADTMLTGFVNSNTPDPQSTKHLQEIKINKTATKNYKRCPRCEIKFDNSKEYRIHSQLCGPKDKFCGVCNASFKRLDHLNRHIRSLHSKQRTFFCPVCNEDCKRQFVLVNHMKKRHPDNDIPFKCQDCEYTSLSLSELLVHEDKHFFAIRHSCPHCDVTFKRRDHMLRHIRAQHSGDEFKFACPICSVLYKRRDHVTRHIREKHHTSQICSNELLPT